MKYTYIIAEGGVAHEGSYTNALSLLNIASGAGADAFKLQWGAKGMMGANRELPFLKVDQMYAISQETSRRGLDFICTPHDQWALEKLELMDMCKAYKVGSGDWHMLGAVLGAGKRTYISTGMHDRYDIEEMVHTYDDFNTVFMHCVSEYPTPPENAQLEMLCHLQEMTYRPIGYSDHTDGIAIPLAAISYMDGTLAALEKHITLERFVDGKQDTFCASDHNEFAELVRGVRHIKDALQPVDDRRPTKGEALTRAWVKKRLDHARQQK
jgi:N,N'-diacetyllegionaminate synthase